MPSPEHIDLVYAPVDRSGGLASGSSKSELPFEKVKAALVGRNIGDVLGDKELEDALRNMVDSLDMEEVYDAIYRIPGGIALLEEVYAGAGILEKLEEAGIVPPKEISNPYDPETDTNLYERWWQEHPEEKKAFTNSVDERDKILQFLTLETEKEQLYGKSIRKPPPWGGLPGSPPLAMRFRSRFSQKK